MRGCRLIWRSITCRRFCDVLKEPIFHIVFRQSNLGACMIFISYHDLLSFKIEGFFLLFVLCRAIDLYVYAHVSASSLHRHSCVPCVLYSSYYMTYETRICIGNRYLYSSILLILFLLYSKLLGYIFGWKESCVVICGSAEHWYIAKLKKWFLYPEISYIKSHTNVVWSSFYPLATMERLASLHWMIVLLILLSEYYNLCLVTLLLTTFIYRLESRCSYDDSRLLNTSYIRSTRLIILSKISISFDIMTDRCWYGPVTLRIVYDCTELSICIVGRLSRDSS